MAGQIIPRGPKKWLLRVHIGRDGLGKRHDASKMVTGTFAAAQKELTLLLAEVAKQGNVAPNRQTVESFYPDWLASKKGITDYTRSQYEARYVSDILPFFGKTLLKDITPQLVQRWVGWLEGERQLSPRTIQYSATVLKQLLRLAFRWQLIPAVPTDGLELPAQERKEQAVLAPADIQKLLRATAGDELWGALWAVLLTGGLRPQEARALKADSLQGSVLSISEAVKNDGKGGVVVGGPKTRKSRRTVALPESVADQLRAHLKRAGIINGLMFRNVRGGILDHAAVQKAWTAACEKAGVPHVRLYDTRHSHFTALLAAGVPLKVASERAGHASVTITGDIYSHVLPEMDDRAAAAMGALLAANG